MCVEIGGEGCSHPQFIYCNDRVQEEAGQKPELHRVARECVGVCSIP